jgi:hypothetical protein
MNLSALSRSQESFKRLLVIRATHGPFEANEMPDPKKKAARDFLIGLFAPPPAY